MLVYDISSRESYNALGNWLTDAQNLANPNLVVLLVGNKRDLEEDRQVSFLEASRFAQENGDCSSILQQITLVTNFFYICRSGVLRS